jgi:hypothetical protein
MEGVGGRGATLLVISMTILCALSLQRSSKSRKSLAESVESIYLKRVKPWDRNIVVGEREENRALRGGPWVSAGIGAEAEAD